MQRRPVKPENWKGVEDGLEHTKVLLKQGKLLEAEAVLREILEFSHSEARVWHLLGRIQQAQHMHDKAQHSFTAASRHYKQGEIKQRTAPVSLRLAKLLITQGDTDGAQSMLQTLLKKDPDNHEVQHIYQSLQGVSS